MINPIDSSDIYGNIYNNNSNIAVDQKILKNQQVNDTVSINSIGVVDKELEDVFNNVMGDLAVNQTDLADLHSGLTFDRVKSLLSL